MSQTFTFEGDDDFEATRAAEAWCRKNGYSVGAMQRDAPRGIMHGDYDIAKWRNLSGRDRKLLHGLMESPSPRHGPVTVTIFNAADSK